MAGLKDYLKKRAQSRLYKQWVEQSQLPGEEIPPELSDTQSRASKTPENIGTKDAGVPSLTVKGMINLPIKYLIFMLLFIAILLVALSVVTTLLIAGS
jgi:hypothetical protein